MKKPWLAALLNFFFMGPGTFYNGRRRLFGAALTLGAIGLTYVEFSIRPLNTTLWAIMFACVLLLNTFFAIDGWREAQAINEA